jgi:hypothetical protein
VADEYVRREDLDQRFVGIEKRMEQGFAHAEKARDQGFVHVNERFNDLNKRFDDLNQVMNKRFDDLRSLIVMVHTPVVIALLAAIAGAVVKYLFFGN